MAVVVVNFDGTRVNDAEALGSVWTDLGGGKAAQEPDFVYQNTYAVSEKVGTSEGGVAYDGAGTTHDYTTPNVWIAKHIATNAAALNNKGSTGGILEIGSGGIRSAYDQYYVVGGDTYPIKGGWLITPIDPNGTPSNTPGASPTLTTINYYGWAATFGATSKAENVAMDAIDFVENGKGLTISGGDGATNDATFDDFVSTDEGNNLNRWGIVSTLEGIIYVTGTLTIATSGTATEFTDADQVLVFPDAEFLNSTGFFGVDFNLVNSGTNISISNTVFKSQGTTSGTDTRPDYVTSGGEGSLTITDSTFDVFRQWTLTSGVTLNGCTFLRGNAMTQASGTITSCSFSEDTTGSGVALITSDDPSLISYSDFNFSTSGHAIELTQSGTYDFTGNTFTGYAAQSGVESDRAIYNNSGGLVTLNLLDTTDVPSYRNGAGASTSADLSVNLKITVNDESGVGVATAQTAIYRTSDDVVLMNEDTTVSGIAEQGFVYSGVEVPIYYRVRKASTGDTKYQNFEGAGTIDSNGFTATVRLLADTIVSS